MTIRRVDLSHTGFSDGDGTTWDNDGGGNDAFHGSSGMVAAYVASAAGDIIYKRGALSESLGASITLPCDNALAGNINQVRVISVRTDAGDTVVKGDIILGFREGDATKAHAQTGGEAPPTFTQQAGNRDMTFGGGFFLYGFKLASEGRIEFGSNGDGPHNITLEECSFACTDTGRGIDFGENDNASPSTIITAKHSTFALATGNVFRLTENVLADFYDCVFTTVDAGSFEAFEFGGVVRLFACDLSGCHATLFDIAGFHGGRVELHNCKMPASHLLTTGTATGFYTVVNYGSEDSTGLTTGGSEQAMEIHTHQGTVELEDIIVRTGGATDLAAGLFAYKVTADNVTDNFVGVEIPLRDIWVEGDGTAKTYKAFIANDIAPGTDYQDNEVYLRLSSPSGAGVSMYDYLPDESAPLIGTLDYDAQTANFTVGATLTGGTSNAHGIITADTDAGDTGTLTLEGINGTFQNDETITDDNGTPGSATSNGTLTKTFQGGLTQLLGTAIDLTDDTGSTWGGTLAYDAQTANFTVGALLTGGTSGATATILADVDAGSTGTLTLAGITGVFQTNETITDDNGSPGSATSDGVATTGSNHQTVQNSIDPDYEGVVHGTLIFSRSGSDVLYVDPLPTVT